MSVAGELLNACLTNKAGASIARVGALLTDGAGALFGVTALAPLIKRDIRALYVDGSPIGHWREIGAQDCASPDIRQTCALIEFNSDIPHSACAVADPLMPEVCALERAYRQRVLIRGAESNGVVHMRRRPVHFMLHGASALLTETVAVRFDESAAPALAPGRLVVTEERREPLGIIIGGAPDYCLLAPLALFLISGRYKLAHYEGVTRDLIEKAAEPQKEAFEKAFETEGWSSDVPEKWAKAA